MSEAENMNMLYFFFGKLPAYDLCLLFCLVVFFFLNSRGSLCGAEIAQDKTISFLSLSMTLLMVAFLF